MPLTAVSYSNKRSFMLIKAAPYPIGYNVLPTIPVAGEEAR